MNRSWLALPILLAVSACGGGGSQSQSTIPAVPLQAQSEAQLDSESRLGSIDSVPTSNDLLYIGNQGNNSITVYHHDASGDSAPLKVISGSKTGLSTPGQLSEDAQGNLYVANGIVSDSSYTGSVLVFAHGANGNVAPIRKLKLPFPNGGGVEAMTVDQSTGKIFVMVDDEPGSGGVSRLQRYPPNATGNQTPYAQSADDYYFATQLASDSTGKNVIEANVGACCNSVSQSVETLEKQFANNADNIAVYDVMDLPSGGVADDPTTKTYLASASGGIYRLKEDTTRDANEQSDGPFKPAVVSIITGSSVSNCGQLALGYLRNIYAVCGSAVNVYTHDSSGDVPPLRILHGSATKLNQPYGIYEGK